MAQTHLKKLRKICLSLPATEETNNFGHEWFRVNKKPFCVNHGPAGEPAIAFKVAKTEQGIFLEDPRFFKTPYMHHNGWVSIRAVEKLDWEEIEELVKGSYRLAAPRRQMNHGSKNASSKSGGRK
jgi:predicted DNA-binding protein (MmcQ/YjbR family)